MGMIVLEVISFINNNLGLEYVTGSVSSYMNMMEAQLIFRTNGNTQKFPMLIEFRQLGYIEINGVNHNNI